jgi:DNA gyrase/topoisomerase IV subunit A
MSEVTNGGSERLPVAIEDEMKSSFMDYAMSVIIARAMMTLMA